jgi:Tfp pilus assembly protein PilN
MAWDASFSRNLRKLVAFGSGVGIEIAGKNLEVVAARLRPSRIHVLGRLVIEDFAARPAAEWGGEYSRFLNSLGASHLSATVLLPRRAVIVRQLALPGVASKDLESAIRLQLDTLHPYGEDDVVWGWSSLSGGYALVGMARRADIDHYIQLFAEAGIPASMFTFSAAAVHAAIRLNHASRHEGFVALSRGAGGSVEVYGESSGRPLFSAEFQMPPDRAAALAFSELRLPPDTEPRSLEDVLPKPGVNPVENDLSRNALPYAAALAGACPRIAPAANLLPPEHRRTVSRVMFIPTIALAAILLILIGAMAVFAAVEDRKYLNRINTEIAKLDSEARRVAAIDREMARMRANARLLDQFRSQTRGDLDALNELTKVIAPPAWTNSIELTRDETRIAGEAPQAAPLIQILDSSPFFVNSGFTLDTRGATGEVFQIHANRRKQN